MFDAYLEQPAKDWSRLLLEASREAEVRAEPEEREEEAQRAKGTTPALALGQYEGTCADSMYGEATVRNEASGLVLQYGNITADLAHWHYDIFRATWRSLRLGEMYVTFTLGPAGRVAGMTLPGLVTFDRKPEVADTNESRRAGTAP